MNGHVPIRSHVSHVESGSGSWIWAKHIYNMTTFLHAAVTEFLCRRCPAESLLCEGTAQYGNRLL